MQKTDLSRASALQNRNNVVARLTEEEHWAWREWCVYHRTSGAKALRDALFGLMAASPVPPRVSPLKGHHSGSLEGGVTP